MVLPSLLEYSSESLEHKLTTILQREEEYRTICKQKKTSFHLDFVLKQFAQDRNVLQSISPAIVLAQLDTLFGDQEILVSIHLMGEQVDMIDMYNWFSSYSPNPKWEYHIYVSQPYLATFESIEQPYFQLGEWFDLNEWNIDTRFTYDRNLLMTVLAGKSGQKKTKEVHTAALQIAEMNPQALFLYDGGWRLNDSIPDACDMVSYGSFWSQFN